MSIGVYARISKHGEMIFLNIRLCLSVFVHFLYMFLNLALALFLLYRDGDGLFDGGPLHPAADRRSSHVSPHVLRMCGFSPREHLPPADGQF